MFASCKSCKFFKLNEDEELMGWCRKYPPQVYLVRVLPNGAQTTGTSFPYMNGEHGWCGEHEFAASQ